MAADVQGLDHIFVHSQEAERCTHTGAQLMSFFSFMLQHPLPQGNVLVSTKLSWNQLHRHTQKFVFMALLSPIKSTVKISPHQKALVELFCLWVVFQVFWWDCLLLWP